MTPQRLCVSAMGEPRYECPHDEEAWITIDQDAPASATTPAMHRFVDDFRTYLVARGLNAPTLLLETWPQVLKSYRRRWPQVGI